RRARPKADISPTPVFACTGASARSTARSSVRQPARKVLNRRIMPLYYLRGRGLAGLLSDPGGVAKTMGNVAPEFYADPAADRFGKGLGQWVWIPAGP